MWPGEIDHISNLGKTYSTLFIEQDYHTKGIVWDTKTGFTQPILFIISDIIPNILDLDLSWIWNQQVILQHMTIKSCIH